MSVAPNCAVGMDVGGTKIAAGIVTFPEGQVLARRLIPTGAQRPGEAVLTDALALARALRDEAASLGLVLAGIGVGVAELVSPDGTITSEQTIAWRGLPVQASFDALAPAVLDADVRVAARGEAHFGAGRGFDPWIYLTVGTGISYSLVQRGQPYPGARGNALICASAPLSATCTVCGADLHPVLEEVASGPALVTRYNRGADRRAGNGQEVLTAASAGDTVAAEVVRSAGAALGSTVGFLINCLDPEAVVVGGGLGLAGGLYWETFIAATRAHIWADAAHALPIIPAGLATDAGLVGAALSAWRHWVPAGTGRSPQARPANL